jgi:phosphatidylserine/phosphatidylglycerophosphate/cardiolipin synthase-like enzyme
MVEAADRRYVSMLRLGVACAATLIVALGLAAGGPSPARADTPYMDAVLGAMRRVSPRLEGTVYMRTPRNQVIGYDGSATSWLLQTPDCWGLSACPANPPSFTRYLNSLRSDLAAAKTQVDITTLYPFPSGGFGQAIVDGLKAALQAGQNPSVRIMAGCYPACITQGLLGPSGYVKDLERAIGTPHGLKPKIYAASYRFYTESLRDDAFSWNHSKIVAVDGRTAIIGGHNMFPSDYLQTTNPVHDVTMRVVGPIAGAGHRFANLIWHEACIVHKWWSGFRYLSYAHSSGAPSKCPGNLTPRVPHGAGTTDILGIGRVGFLYRMPDKIAGAIRATLADVGRRSRPPSAAAAASGPVDPAPCAFLPTTDYTNSSPRYDEYNPGETGLRELIASAKFDVFLSQQDLVGPCPLAPRFDRRLLDVIVDRLRAGVRVRIVTSTPKAKLSLLVPYSNASSLTDTTSAIYNRAWAKLGDPNAARRLLEENLRVGSLRFTSNVPTWPGGGSYNLIANHAKVIEVDRRAFYVGSENLYPAWLAEYGLLLDDPTVAGQFNKMYADPLWRASCVTDISSPDQNAPVVGDCSIPDKPPQCAGEFATIVGTPRRDQIRGTSGPDVIAALGGSDVVKGSGGNDVLCGGSGDDTLRGEAGRDTVLGQAGSDTLKGGPGDDLLKGGPGDDLLKGGRGDDTLRQDRR